jgi:hypothetical protein
VRRAFIRPSIRGSHHLDVRDIAAVINHSRIDARCPAVWRLSLHPYKGVRACKWVSAL